MNLENVFVIDAEFDGFLDKLTKMHVMSVGYFTPNGWKIKSTPNKSDVKKVFENPNNTVVGHNFISFDLPALKKVYPDIDFKALIVDTLPLSQYLHPNRIKHSLESWANEINGVSKVEMTDWKNLTYEEYRERCHADVEINIHIWLDFYQNLKELYLENISGLMGAVKLGNFIREVLRIQEENPIKVDVKKCKDNLNFLEGIINEKVEQLASIMPRVPKIAIKKKPSILFKKDGSMSLAHIKWLQFLQGCDLPEDTEGSVEYISSYEDPNPQSNSQMKAYLFTKKWIPKLFKDGANGKVPQLRDDDKNLCTSIIKLIDKVPELESLSGLSVAQHRAGYLKAFLDTMDENGFVRAKFSSIAKTWRVKHIKPIVNLPSNDSEYGDLVRSCLVAPKDKYFVNYDLDSLEDRTKRACIIHIDPDYVKEMSDPDYDPHLAIGVQAGLLSQDESDFFKWFKSDKKKGECPEIFRVYSEEGMYEQFKRLSKVRSASKTTNYAATYMASAKKIAETADITLKLAQQLHSAYWEKNASVKVFTESLTVKRVRGLDWIYSPYTNMWLYLSSDHIKFSALNQNFGSKIHFMLLYFLVEKGYKPIMNIHDEGSMYIGRTDFDKSKFDKDLKDAMGEVNKAFDFGVEFGSSAEYADSYGDVH